MDRNSLRSSVMFPQSLMICGAMSTAAAGPVFSEVHAASNVCLYTV